ncbi:MAG: sulfite exporter TauE/SafE family protein [Cyanobacteriota bacterium]
MGIGGALLMLPILLYVPGLFGHDKIPVHMITGMVSMQSLFGTATSSFFHHKTGNVNYYLVLNIGIGMAIGAFTGAVFSKYLHGNIIIWIYIFVLAFSAISMIFHKEKEPEELPEKKISRYKYIIFGLLVGLPAGAIGFAGSVVVIPLLNTLFDVPIKICISSSTHIAFIASLLTFIGKSATGQIEFLSALIISVSAMIGAFIGTKLNKKADPRLLKNILLTLIVLVFLRLLVDMLWN